VSRHLDSRLADTDIDPTEFDDNPLDDSPGTLHRIMCTSTDDTEDTFVGYDDSFDDRDLQSVNVDLSPASAVSSPGNDSVGNIRSVLFPTDGPPDVASRAIDTPVKDTVAQIDSGANLSTTNQASLLWNLHKLDRPRELIDAGQHSHIARYRGLIVVPCDHGMCKAVITYYTPTINATIISPNAICQQFRSVKHYAANMNVDDASGRIVFKNGTHEALFTIPVTTRNGLQWTRSVVRPNYLQKHSPIPVRYINAVRVAPHFLHFPDHLFDDANIDDMIDHIDPGPSPSDIVHSVDLGEHVPNEHVHQLKLKTQTQLYHQRLGHMNFRAVSEMHQHVDGIPKVPLPSVIDACPVCIAAKMRKASSSAQTCRTATQCFQGLGIDMGFIVQQSKNTKRYQDSLGINGEACYILITDHYSGMMFGQPLEHKTVPLDWLNKWLARHSPDIQHKTVRMDQGHELGRSKAVRCLLEQHGYQIELTGADASHQNGTVERSHETLGNMIRSLLLGANLPKKFWPYAFYHSLFLQNRVIHG
jgi:GAG-pre-integrase domain